MPRSRASRLQIVGLCFVAAMLLAAVVAVSPVLTALQKDTATSESERDSRPALRLAQRAGLVTVGLEARDDGYRITLNPPEIDDMPAPTVTGMRVSSNGRRAATLPVASCGEACSTADENVPAGSVALDVDIDYASQQDTARFRFSWPMPPNAQPLLERVARRTSALDKVWVRERVTSNPRSGLYANPPKLVTGDDLANTYAAAGAQDARVLLASNGLRRIVYYVPTVTLWVEVWVTPGGRIVRDRFMSRTRLWTQTHTLP